MIGIFNFNHRKGVKCRLYNIPQSNKSLIKEPQNKELTNRLNKKFWNEILDEVRIIRENID